MRKGGSAATDRREREGWIILLIDDDARFGGNRQVDVEECGGSTIITARSRGIAFGVLDVAAVDVVYNFTASSNREEAEQFRSRVVRRYPSIRVTDLWTDGPRREHADSVPGVPLFLRGGMHCEAEIRAYCADETSEQYRLCGYYRKAFGGGTAAACAEKPRGMRVPGSGDDPLSVQGAEE